jgi:dUTP pyrophosphatase
MFDNEESLIDGIVFDEVTGEIKVVVKIINNSKNPDPEFKLNGDSGFDLRANLESPIVLKPMERKLIPTGLHTQFMDMYELQIRPRSGLAINHGITVLNSPSTIDSNYRGEIKIILINLGSEDFIINNNDRVAQGVIAPVMGSNKILFKKVDSLDNSERNENGFGSTGKN